MRLLARTSILLGTVLVLLYFASMGPVYNWDMIGYVAAAYHKDGYRGQELLDKTYSDIRNEVGADVYADLVGGRNPHYRQTVAADPVALEQQLPFYSIRIVYVELMRGLKRLGMEYPASTYRISIVFSVLCVFALGLLCIQQRVPLMAVPFVVLAAGYVDLVALSLPDAMACFFALLATWAVLDGRKLAYLLAALLPLVRTDYFILSCFLMGYCFWKGNRIASVITVVAVLAVYGVTNAAHAHYGWLTLFNFTFMEFSPYPAELRLSTNPMDYIKPYIAATTTFLTHAHMPFYFLALFLLARRGKIKIVSIEASHLLLLLIPLLFLAVHLALFPLLQERFFVYSSSLVLIWIMKQLDPGITQCDPRSSPACG
ncbi:MAG: hypothetical protein ACOY7J_16390 [Pseudomonadota bacterium]